MTDRIIYPSDGPIKRFLKKLVRKKIIDEENVDQTQLSRCLTTLDLIGLGIGSTLGAGIYVVAGQVAQQTAGPSVVIAFLIAAVASALAGLCYAEFAARVPKAGSAYVYSYVTVGELMAFVIGWNLVLEYVIGTASVARAWSSYFDSLVDSKIQHFFQEHMPMDVPGLSSYPDFFAFGITLVLTGILAIGVKESTTFNNIFTCVNLLVVLYVIICGLFKLNLHNWQLTHVPSSAGSGGFMPFGVSGMLSGAATCFYAFVGFDCIATTGEETQNPQRSIPIGIIVSLLIIFLAYFGISAVITLMVPYYLLDNQAPLPKVFDSVGWGVAKYIIAIGAVSGLSTSLLGAMFPLPRVLYAMGSDGVIFRFMGKVNERFKTPVKGTVISGVFAGAMAMLFNLKELVDMMSIGTLLAYTLVAVSVLILRYETEENLPGSASRRSLREAEIAGNGTLERRRTIHVSQLFLPVSEIPSKTSALVAISAIWIFCLCCILFSCVLIFLDEQLVSLQWWAILLACAFGLCLLTSMLVVWRQPCSQVPLNFKVPFVPLLPCVSVFINLFLMLKLSYQTWMRFGVWMVIGAVIYFGYGIRNSNEGMTVFLESPTKYQTIQSSPRASSHSSQLPAEEEQEEEGEERNQEYVLPVAFKDPSNSC